MIINPILFVMSLPSFFIEEYITSLNKCSIQWKIVNINIASKDSCFYNMDVLIDNDNSFFLVTTNVLKGDCFVDYVYKYYDNDNFFKLWKIVDFLVDKENNYTLISDNKLSEWEYRVWGIGVSEWNFEFCKPNANESDLEIAQKKTEISLYLNDLHNKKPRTAKKLLTALEDLNLSSFNQDTNILVLYAKEVLKMLAGNL
jgi:hypothetical protein